MSGETPAATGTATPSPEAATPPAAPATQTPVPPAGEVTPQATDPNAAPPTDPQTPEGAKPDEAKPDEGEGGAPETYADFAMPDGMTLDQAALDSFTPTFKELGLTQEQAQKLVDRYAERMKAMGEGATEQAEQWYAERRAAEIAKANEDGIAAIKADAEIGGAQFDTVRNRVMRAIETVGTAEFKAKVDKLGLGNDPDLVRTMHRLIDYVPEDMGAAPAGGGGSRSAASLMFDHPTSQHK